MGKHLFILTLFINVACSGTKASSSDHQAFADFSSLYGTWNFIGGYSFEWSAGASSTSSVITHPTDDFDGVNVCDCSVYGYGDASTGQVRLNSCAYRGNPSLSASKCTTAADMSDFNFSPQSGYFEVCFKFANYQNCYSTL